MGGKQTVMKQAQEAYTELERSIAGLDEARASDRWLGTWGVREILIHASGWLQEMRPALERLGRGEAPYPTASPTTTPTGGTRGSSRPAKG